MFYSEKSPSRQKCIQDKMLSFFFFSPCSEYSSLMSPTCRRVSETSKDSTRKEHLHLMKQNKVSEESEGSGVRLEG